MKKIIKAIAFGFCVCAFLAEPLWARPEYALKEKLNCAACHATPWGGGPRNRFGKNYGSHGQTPSAFSSNDLYYGDVRIIGYHPTKPTLRVNGLALMQATATANLPLYEGQNGSEIRSVVSFNQSSLGGAYPREVFLRWQPGAEAGGSQTHFVFGRFYLPFGLLTDEHRSYTRLQTNMTMENFEMGGAISFNFFKTLHTDVALVSNFQAGGNFTTKDATWAGVFNGRWNPRSWPLFLGLSANYQHTIRHPEPLAVSFYTGFGLDQMTEKRLGGSITFEHVRAKNWNNPAMNSGTVHPSFRDFFGVSASEDRHSVGNSLQTKLNLTEKWVALYRLDFLDPDLLQHEDSFVRHGVGLEAYLPGNIILNFRIEKAVIADPGVQSSDVLAAHDDVFLMFRWWI